MLISVSQIMEVEHLFMLMAVHAFFSMKCLFFCSFFYCCLFKWILPEILPNLTTHRTVPHKKNYLTPDGMHAEGEKPYAR